MKGVCLPCQPKILCRPNSVVPPYLLPCRAQQELFGGSGCCFWYSCPPPASMNQARKEMNSCQSDFDQLWENKLGVPLKKKKKRQKILLPFEFLWGHWEQASKLFCSALRDGKLLLIQKNKALHCHYQQQKKLKRLWTLYSRHCGSKEKLQPSQDLATPGPCQQSALPHYCKSQAEPSLLRNIQLWLLEYDK